MNKFMKFLVTVAVVVLVTATSNANAAWKSLGQLQKLKLTQIDSLGLCSYRISVPNGNLKEKILINSQDVQAKQVAIFYVEIPIVADGSLENSFQLQTKNFMRFERAEEYDLNKIRHVFLQISLEGTQVGADFAFSSDIGSGQAFFSSTGKDTPNFLKSVYLEQNCS